MLIYGTRMGPPLHRESALHRVARLGSRFHSRLYPAVGFRRLVRSVGAVPAQRPSSKRDTARGAVAARDDRLLKQRQPSQGRASGSSSRRHRKAARAALGAAAGSADTGGQCRPRAMLEQVGKFPPRGSGGGGGVKKLEQVKGKGMSESLDPMANSSDKGALQRPFCSARRQCHGCRR